MHGRWFNTTVFLLWLTMMSWLVRQKVLPSLLVGEPPNYATILEAQQEQPLVGWRLLWNDRRLGWALSSTTPLPHGLTETNSRLHFNDLPVDEMTPDWLRTIVGPMGRHRAKVPLDAVGTLIFDPLGRLSRFESAIQFQPKVDALKVRGTIDDATLSLTVKAGDFTYDKELPLPGSAMLSDALSPQSQLPGLREGQSWTVKVYSPLLPPNSPLEIVQARVEGKEPMHWEGKTIYAWLVVYRDDSGAASSRPKDSRGRLWVRPEDGTVIKQEVKLLSSTLTLVRLSRGAAASLARSVAQRESARYHGTIDLEDAERNE